MTLKGLFFSTDKVKVKVAQSYLTLCKSMDYIAHGILQDRILEWVAFLFARISFQPRDRAQISHIYQLSHSESARILE